MTGEAASPGSVSVSALEHQMPEPASPSINPGETTSPVTVGNERQNAPQKRYEAVVGGANEDTRLPDSTLKTIGGILRDRLVDTKKVGETRQGSSSDIDRLLLALGEEGIARLENGDYGNEELKLSYYAISEQLLKSSFAVSKIVSDNPKHEGLKRIPIIGLLAKIETRTNNAVIQLKSALATERGVEGWDEQRIIDEFTKLNDARRAILEGAFNRGFRDSAFDQISTSSDPIEFIKKTGNRYNDLIVEHLQGELEGLINQRFPGETFATLIGVPNPTTARPLEAIRLLNEATQRAASEAAPTYAKEVLNQETPTVDSERIEAQAKKAAAPPKEADLVPLREALAAKNETVTSATTRLSELQNKLATAEGILPEKILTFNEIYKVFGKVEPELRNQIKSLQNEIDNLLLKIDNITPPATLSPKEQAEFIKTQTARFSSQIAIDRATIKEREDTLVSLLKDEANAEADKDFYGAQISEIKGPSTSPGTIAEAEEKLKKAKSAAKTAQGKVNKKQEEIDNGASEEGKEQATGIRTWGKTVPARLEILDKQTSQREGDEFSRINLASTENEGNQLKGAERIRKLIFETVLKQDYDPELARKMLPDEAIAKAINWIYRVDTSAGTPAERLLTNLANYKSALQVAKENWDADTTNATLKSTFERATRDLRQAEKALLFNRLRYLKGSNFKVGDLITFIIKEGVLSAQRGEPNLKLEDERFLKNRQELNV
jgi:hypothetical protein